MSTEPEPVVTTCGQKTASKGTCCRDATFLASIDFQVIATEVCAQHLPNLVRWLARTGRDVIVRPITPNPTSK